MKEIEQPRVAVIYMYNAPYRSDLYDWTQKALSSRNGNLFVFSTCFELPNNPWTALERNPKHARLVTLRYRLIKNTHVFIPRRDLFDNLKAIDCSLVWVHEFSLFSIAAIIWGKLHNVPTVLSTDIGPNFSNIFSAFKMKRSKRYRQALILRLVDKVICCTPDAMTRLAKSKKPHIFCPHAIDTHEFTFKCRKAAHPGPVYFLQVAGINYWKGWDLLLEAFSTAVKVNSNMCLTFVGEGAPADLYATAEKLSIRDKVTVFPFAEKPTLLQHYHDADVFVLASRTDTYGVVGHEAASCGLPLMLSKYAGVSQVFLKDQEAGFQFDPEDTAAFAALLVKLADDGELRHSMGLVARKIAEEYCVRKLGSQLGSFLTEPSR